MHVELIGHFGVDALEDLPPSKGALSPGDRPAAPRASVQPSGPVVLAALAAFRGRPQDGSLGAPVAMQVSQGAGAKNLNRSSTIRIHSCTLTRARLVRALRGVAGWSGSPKYPSQPSRQPDLAAPVLRFSCHSDPPVSDPTSFRTCCHDNRTAWRPGGSECSLELPVGPLFCVITGPACGRRWLPGGMRWRSRAGRRRSRWRRMPWGILPLDATRAPGGLCRASSRGQRNAP